MVSLYTALKLMKINENEVVILVNMETMEREYATFRQIREKYDMRRTKVCGICPEFYKEDGSFKGMKFYLREEKAG